MRLVPAIVEAEVDESAVTQALIREHIAYQDRERTLDATEKKAEGLRGQQRDSRIAMGGYLIDLKRITKHGGWMPRLEKLGIPERTARAWMQEAGYVEEAKSASNANDADLASKSANTRVASGVDRRPRKRDEQPDPPDADEEPRPPATDWSAKLTRGIDRIRTDIVEFAQSEAKEERARARLVHELRETINLVEKMK